MNFLVLVLIAAAIFLASLAVQSGFAQMEDHGSSIGNQTVDDATSSPPIVMTTEDGRVDVKLSWEPEVLDIDQPAQFTVVFLDHETGDRLKDVTYAVHMSLDGRSIGHGHNGTAPNGTGEFEQSFDSTGSLSMIMEVQQAGGVDINQVAQFSIAVTPEIPVAVFALVTGMALAITVSAGAGKRRAGIHS